MTKIAAAADSAREPEWDEQVAREYRDAYARTPETEEERRSAEYLFELSMRDLPPW